MKSIAAVMVLGLTLANSAFASVYIVCGKNVDLQNSRVTEGFEMKVSSESDLFKGNNGKNWNLGLDSQDGKWLKPTRAVSASMETVDGSVNVTITVQTGKSASGSVGTKYILLDIYNETPILEKYTMGGFAGVTKVGTFNCASSND